MVSEGLTPPTVGNTEPWQIHRLGKPKLLKCWSAKFVIGLFIDDPLLLQSTTRGKSTVASRLCFADE